MIFASDLDRTLIYSDKFLEDMSEDEVRLIEKKGEQEISFMTETAIDLLKDLSENILFVPVTTRTIAQYRRIKLFQNEIVPKYAVVSNGGNLLIDGEIDLQWNQQIHNRIATECLPFEDVLTRFQEIQSDEWVLNKRMADDLFSYCIVDRKKVPMDDLMSFTDWLTQHNWKASLQGRKLYFVPQCVSKGDALDYIQERESIDFVAAAGDSLLDLPMLHMADYAIAPPHGEINQIYEEESLAIESILFTEKEGILAAEEILERVQEFAERYPLVTTI
ncbi:HAD family hydrolase [Clostridiaceae bacterium 35-E11]